MSGNQFETPSIREESITSLSKKLLAVTEQLTQSNQELQQLQKERADMLANLSHDLRAPVTAIRGAVDYLLADGDCSAEERNSVLHMIDRRTKALENLINDMYDLFCVETSDRGFPTQQVAAAPFLEEYFYSTILDSRYDSHQMNLELPSSVTGSICINVQKMIRVLDNLMTNAAKYSDPNSPITLKAAQDENYLTVSVIDKGMGIPQDALDKVFSRTYTVCSARTPNSATGSGLGLSIAKAITEKHQGTLRCESILGEGSTFILTLPLTSSQSL